MGTRRQRSQRPILTTRCQCLSSGKCATFKDAADVEIFPSGDTVCLPSRIKRPTRLSVAYSAPPIWAFVLALGDPSNSRASVLHGNYTSTEEAPFRHQSRVKLSTAYITSMYNSSRRAIMTTSMASVPRHTTYSRLKLEGVECPLCLRNVTLI